MGRFFTPTAELKGPTTAEAPWAMAGRLGHGDGNRGLRLVVDNHDLEVASEHTARGIDLGDRQLRTMQHVDAGARLCPRHRPFDGHLDRGL